MLDYIAVQNSRVCRTGKSQIAHCFEIGPLPNVNQVLFVISNIQMFCFCFNWLITFYHYRSIKKSFHLNITFKTKPNKCFTIVYSCLRRLKKCAHVINQESHNFFVPIWENRPSDLF